VVSLVNVGLVPVGCIVRPIYLEKACVSIKITLVYGTFAIAWGNRKSVRQPKKKVDLRRVELWSKRIKEYCVPPATFLRKSLGKRRGSNTTSMVEESRLKAKAPGIREPKTWTPAIYADTSASKNKTRATTQTTGLLFGGAPFAF
jgi:hypothetical protein